MTKCIHLGVVGCGYWGPNLARNFRALPDCEVAWLCDTQMSRIDHLRRLYPEAATYTEFAAALRSPDLDAVAIATPVHTHHAIARASLLAGKHVLLEKPMASTSAQCEDLIALAEERGLVLMVGHTFLYSPAVRKMKEIVDSGDLGEVFYISARRLNLGLFQKDINVVWDLAPHDLSIALYVKGEVPVAVNCSGSSNVTPGIEDVSNLTLHFPGGGVAMIHSSWLDPKKVRDMAVVGSRRMLHYDDLEPLQKIKIYDQHVEAPPHYDTFAEFQYSYHYGDMYAPYIRQEEPLKIECQHFLECLRTGQPPLTDGRSGLQLVRILEAASASLQYDGRRVSLTHVPAAAAGPIAARN